MSFNNILCNCGMLFCKDIDRTRPGSTSSFLSNVATMFFKSLTTSNNNVISNETTTTDTVDNDMNKCNDDDSSLYCIPIKTNNKLKRKRKVSTKEKKKRSVG